MGERRIAIGSLKDNIIINVMDYMETKNCRYKNKAIELLHDFAKFYFIKLKKSKSFNKHSFREFIINDKGYNETINGLYNYLINN